MSHRVQAVAGVRGLSLPNGWELDGGDTVVVPDSVWAQIEADVETLGRLLDLGSTTDIPDAVPTWRDIQRATAGSDTGLADDVAALSAELGAHEAATTNVHGIDDTSLLETQAGAQSKADAAQAAAEATAAAALAAHAADTTGVHGIADTALLETQADAQAKADAAEAAAEAYADAEIAAAIAAFDPSIVDGGIPSTSYVLSGIDGGAP